MYAVVGCDRCSALWVVEGRPETTQCPRCRKRHRYESRKKFVETGDADHARGARAAMLADRGTPDDASLDLDFADMERDARDAGMSDEAYLDAAGVDADAVADAGANTGERSSGSGSSRSRRAVVLDALDDLDRPTEADVVEYAAADNVPADYVRKALGKLVERGEVTETDGRYRRL